MRVTCARSAWCAISCSCSARRSSCSSCPCRSTSSACAAAPAARAAVRVLSRVRSCCAALLLRRASAAASQAAAASEGAASEGAGAGSSSGGGSAEDAASAGATSADAEARSGVAGGRERCPVAVSPVAERRREVAPMRGMLGEARLAGRGRDLTGLDADPRGVRWRGVAGRRSGLLRPGPRPAPGILSEMSGRYAERRLSRSSYAFGPGDRSKCLPEV